MSGPSLMVSVDVEADGPCPPIWSMVSLGAVVVEPGLSRSFRGETAPLAGARYLPKALEVSGTTRQRHLSYGHPGPVMARFREWLRGLAPGRRLTFVSDNPAFDWQWVNWYFHAFPAPDFVCEFCSEKERLLVPARLPAHVEGRRLWCEEHTPWSGHYENCPEPCRTTMAKEYARMDPNPFGHSARRIGDIWSGLRRAVGDHTSWKDLRRTRHTHDPVSDAMGNAEALLEIMGRMAAPPGGTP